jgi:hypothetical protein
MTKNLIFFLLFGTVSFLFANDNINVSTSQEVILEDPYKPTRQQETEKSVDIKDVIAENIYSIYNKANTFKNSFEIDKLFESVRQFFISTKKVVLKIKWFIYNTYILIINKINY